MRGLPFFKPKNKPQFAGLNFSDGGGGGGGSSHGYNYSTTPYTTGKKWIDGRDVMGVVLTGSVTSNSQDIDVETLNIDKLFIKSVFIDDTYAITGQYYWNSSNDYFKMDLRTNKTVLSFNIPSAFVGKDYIFIAEYVEKTT